MPDIVIHCPNPVHDQPRYCRKSDEMKVVPKILIIVSADTVGKIKVQCNDSQCKHSIEGHRGWYEIDINGLGGCAVKSIPKQYFKLNEVPILIMDEE